MLKFQYLCFQLILLILFIISGEASAQEPVTPMMCSGTQYICIDEPVYELCITFEAGQDYPFTIQEFVLDWGDGTEITIPATLEQVTQFHEYDLASFFDLCIDEEKYFVTLFTYIAGQADPLDDPIPVYFRNEPRAIFTASSTACVGIETCFQDFSCPEGTITSTLWNYGDGNTGTEPCHTYNITGTYTVSLTVENHCGTSTTTQQIEIIDQAIAQIEPDSGFVLNNNSEYLICLGAGGAFTLTGDSSPNSTSYTWSSSSGNFSWLSPQNQAEVTIQVNTPGTYFFTLTVNNACNVTDQTTFEVTVLDAESPILSPQADACEPLQYTPNPFDPNFNYTINGTPVSNFPFPIGLSNNPVVVQASLTNDCGTQMVVDTFFVSPPQNAEIEDPTSIQLCSADGPFQLTATPEFGNYHTANNSSCVTPAGLIDPGCIQDSLVVFFGGACLVPDSVVIYVINNDISLALDPPGFCATDTDTYLPTTGSIPGNFWGLPGIDPMTGAITPSLFPPSTIPYTLNFSVNPTSDSTCYNEASIDFLVSELFGEFQILECMGNTLCFDTLNTSPFSNITWDFGNGTSNVTSPCHTFPGAGTYSVTMTLVFQECVYTYSQDVIVEPPPIALFAVADSSSGCSPLTVEFINNSVGDTFFWDFGNGQTSNEFTPGTVTFIATNGENQTYSVTLTVTNGCGSETFTLNIEVLSSPVSVINTLLPEYCSGDTIATDNNASYGDIESYTWILPDGSISNDSILTPWEAFAEDQPVIQTFTLIVEGICPADTATWDVLINPTDVSASFFMSDSVICVGDTVVFINFSTFLAPVLWEFPNNNTSTADTTYFIFNQPGVFPISLKVFGCGYDQQTATVTVLEAPMADMALPAFACPGEEVFIQNQSLNGGNSYFTTSNGDISTLSNPSFIFQNSGTYSITLLETNLNGCQDSFMETIEIVELPIPDFEFNDSLCAGQEVIFTNLSTGIWETCVWNFGDGQTATGCPQATHTYQTGGIYEVTLTLENSLGCKIDVTYSINIRTVPDPDFEMNLDQNCTPVLVQLINNTQDANSYDWYLNGTFLSSDFEPSLILEEGGAFEITLIAINDGICEASLTKSETITETPIPAISLSSTSGCAVFSLNYAYDFPDPAYTYEWDFGDGNFSFEAAGTHQYTSPDSLLLQLVITNGLCKDSIQEMIEIFTPVQTSAAIEHIACFGENTGQIVLTPVAGNAPFSYQWSNNATANGIFNLPAGPYSCTISDANGCEEIFSTQIDQPNTPLDFQVNRLDTITCFGGADGEIAIEAIGGIAPYNYAWSGGLTDTLLTGLTAGNYLLTITDALNCSFSSTIAIPQRPPISSNDTLILSCFEQDTATYRINNITGGKGPYEVFFSGNGRMEIGTVVNDLMPGIYEVVIEDFLGCQTDYTVEVKERQEVIVVFEPDTFQILLGEVLELSPFVNTTPLEYAWQPVVWTDCSDCDGCLDCPELVVQPLDNQWYEVTGTDLFKCSARDSVFVAVEKIRQIDLPNAFTPNGDNLNDVFTVLAPENPGIQSIITFEIFDRWGQKVFQANDFRPNDQDFGWNGTVNGKRAQVGPYSYRLTVRFLDGYELSQKGIFQLIR